MNGTDGATSEYTSSGDKGSGVFTGVVTVPGDVGVIVGGSVVIVSGLRAVVVGTVIVVDGSSFSPQACRRNRRANANSTGSVEYERLTRLTIL